jgi:hypothetical protein
MRHKLPLHTLSNGLRGNFLGGRFLSIRVVSRGLFPFGVLGCGNATVGATTSQNPYSNQGGPFTSDFLGIPVDIERLLTQTPIGSNGGNQLCSSGPGGTISRVEVYISSFALGAKNQERVDDPIALL